jgi:hypothetical protein
MFQHENRKVNFIKQLVKVYELFWLDKRITPYHISLYHSLFMSWNHFSFSNPLSISRQEQMKHSKIGSVNTYLKCLKELDTWGYIKYVPSRNPQKGSEVYLFIFDTSTDTCIDFNSIKSDTSTDTTSELRVRPLINSIKENKTSINTNSIELDNTRNENDENFVFKKEKNVSKKVETHTPKNVEEVETYFLEKEKPKSEANKFFNFYEANGWLVGKNKMKNWRAAANNWMANIGKYNSNPQKEKTTYLHVEQDKDYSVPL